MNRFTTSLIAFGAGMAAYSWAQKNDVMTTRNMKKMQKKVKRAIF